MQERNSSEGKEKRKGKERGLRATPPTSHLLRVSSHDVAGGRGGPEMEEAGKTLSRVHEKKEEEEEGAKGEGRARESGGGIEVVGPKAG
ncbi:hypothetical protein ALC60_10116 [Trachymyrmex zeteki]|uniref:Uncharacterized protein n=1 Tax=Mycetomoellerius zeteki TaxID=64791 RepID=A0A151WSA2_9HYME|nr:hypothetical protein ALC60_10116 [Trachymyrmex zeteki]